jgi:hypothetical protein
LAEKRDRACDKQATSAFNELNQSKIYRVRFTSSPELFASINCATISLTTTVIFSVADFDSAMIATCREDKNGGSLKLKGLEMSTLDTPAEIAASYFFFVVLHRHAHLMRLPRDDK